jgi:anhydro-N-acetylmuramic acid kinase
MNTIEKLRKARNKETRTVIGLISGTSADGVSAVAIEIRGSGIKTEIQILAFETYKYPLPLRREVFKLFRPETSTVDKICDMNFVLGQVFAEAAIKLMAKSDLGFEDVDFIGSHGQTIYHIPIPLEFCGYKTRSTFQIAEPTIIAERTHTLTIADFRKADIAAGGEGAPLSPYLDYILYRSKSRNRILQNIGGIANFTYLPINSKIDQVIAFDTGPGNMVIDDLVTRFTKGAQTYDKNGYFAQRGKVDEGLLNELLSHPYFSRAPPKTTGREMFGKNYASYIINKNKQSGLEFVDLIATITALTVESIVMAYEMLLLEGKEIDEIYLSGGGANNTSLVESLTARVAPIKVSLCDTLGISSEAKEAVLMAVLANEHIMNNPSNIPKATGASRAVVLGAQYPAL